VQTLVEEGQIIFFHFIFLFVLIAHHPALLAMTPFENSSNAGCLNHHCATPFVV
jgi:hypothetical protein